MIEKGSKLNEDSGQGDPKDLVFVEWREEDFLVPVIAIQLGEMTLDEALNMPQSTIDFIKRGQIDDFCSKCDNYKGAEPCAVGFGNQTRYVARQWCGWASVNGQRCYITKNGIEL